MGLLRPKYATKYKKGGGGVSLCQKLNPPMPKASGASGGPPGASEAVWRPGAFGGLLVPLGASGGLRRPPGASRGLSVVSRGLRGPLGSPRASEGLPGPPRAQRFRRRAPEKAYGAQTNLQQSQRKKQNLKYRRAYGARTSLLQHLYRGRP